MSNSNGVNQFKRLNFFTGFFTTAEDWTDGQTYHLEKRKLHNRGLHTPGIMKLAPFNEKSLMVTAIDPAAMPSQTPPEHWWVQVAPGAALDGNGNLIFLPEVEELDLHKLAAAMKPPIQLGTAPFYLTIGFDENCSDYSANVQDPDYSGYRRVEEKPAFAILKNKPTTPTNDPDATDWLVLAKITVAADADRITDNDIDRSDVPQAGVVDPNRDAELAEIVQTLDTVKEKLRSRVSDTHSYHLQKEQRHNLGIHTPGILRHIGGCFKVVAAGGNDIQIEAGAAIDGEGREIYLAAAQTIPIDLNLAPGHLYVAVQYDDHFDDYLDQLDKLFDGNFNSAKIVLLNTEPNLKNAVKIAYINLRAGANELEQGDIDITDLPWAGSVIVAEAGLDKTLRERIRLVMVDTRKHMAELALRFPSPAVNDTRATALGIQLSLDTLRYEQIASRIQTLADVEQAVHQELGDHYPPLVWQGAFKQYGLDVTALMDGVQQGATPENLLNLQQQVASSAHTLAGVILVPPIARAGEDQFKETFGKPVEITLDASASTAAQGHHIVHYHWENLTTHTVLTTIDQPVYKILLPMGVHVLRLVVEDDAHLRSEPDIVVITIKLSEITISHIEPPSGWRGATIDAVITGTNLDHATEVKAYLHDQEDERVKVNIQPGADREHLPICIRISKLAALGERVLEVVTPFDTATVSFTVVPHELPTVLAIEPVWGMPGALHPLPARIAGDHFEQANAVTFVYGAKPDPGIRTVIRHATPDYLNVDLTISANAEFGRRRFTVTTPAGATISPETVIFTVMPGFLQVAIMLLTVVTAVVHLTLHFPNILFILNGLGYLAFLASLYLPTHWLFVGLRPWMRWVLLGYTLLTMVSWIAMGDRTTLAYMTKMVEALLITLLFVESRQP